MQKKKKREKWKIVVMVISAVILAALIAVICLWLYLTSGVKQVKLDKDDLGITEYKKSDDAEQTGDHVDTKNSKIRNIVFFGIDSTDEQASYGDQYRSDSIIIVSLGEDNKNIKATSILRDSKVPIEGHEPQKINAAYKYGFAPLAIKTINQNFKMNIEDYVTVDFASIEEIVDLLGGVDIEMTEEEASQVPGTHAGLNTLNGAQTVLYSRIRKIDSDYYRASRQQNVITAILTKIKDLPLTSLPGTLNKLMNCVETSLSYADILGILMSLDIRNLNVEYNTIPDYDYETDLWGGIDDDHGEWVWVYDLDKAADRLHEIIYGE